MKKCQKETQKGRFYTLRFKIQSVVSEPAFNHKSFDKIVKNQNVRQKENFAVLTIEP